MTLFSDGQLYIAGKLRDAEGGAKYEDIGPWTGEIVAYAADASAADMEEAIAAARHAFDETDWSTNIALRRKLVKKLGEALKAERERLSEIARHEVGAAVLGVRIAHVDGPLNDIDTLFEIFDTIEWEKPLGDRSSWGIASKRTLVKEAAGVVGVITPWNVPFYITVGKVIPALLAGCTVIIKPAPDTPLLSAIVGELAAKVGFPAGVLNVVTGKDPALLGEMLTTDKRVDLISFTGSTGVGKRIMEKGADTLKRIFLELGGKSAAILLEDTPDFATAVAQSIVCFHAGQGCATITRLLVPRSRYDEAVAVLEAAYAGYSQAWGDFEDPNNVMGPLISARQRDRVMGFIEAGKAEGARLIAGGNVASDKGNGFFVEPTCFVDVTNDMKIAREEIFGPVLVVIPFEDEEDAIRIANDSDYGLSGAVRSADPERAMRVAKRIRTGTVGVNGGLSIAVDLPFGGYKQSGIGKEWGAEGFDEYLETKVISVGA
ncbi:aldehyde dehydrogenase family protein [Sphingomonas sp. BIUV-7]|uniref:Aldehyde dehydrogenase family protein n=1 Tax=Sphingomonas natans TaxID=3063330 RepID=A0ABT8YA36_9SPHN|nr:aldehyde dehydrogenase family protein [Sphingomonas sp. BIUV-7]MDO6414569.1 aldehyde dehydrogenase family protein [Sphingomonas sp. BIUV-7]